MNGFAPRSLEEVIRVEGGRVVATLTRLTGELTAAEDAFADAVEVALARWPADGIPERPGAWLTTVARRKALDRMRREQTRTAREEDAVVLADPDPLPFHTVRDDHLRLIFTCCHPALSPEARVALSLRVLCGLTTTEIARAFLVAEPTMGQRISRAKSKIAAARIPYRVPPDHELPARLAAVLAVVNVVFATGHHAPVGAELVRLDLAEEGIRLARLLVDLMPDEPECIGLLALLESTHARRSTRLDHTGEAVLLADADRTRWDHDAIAAASDLVHQALRRGRPGPYQLQAAISVLHGSAPSVDDTDWPQIVALYDALVRMLPSPAVRVNRAVAVAEVDGPAAGLELLDQIDGIERWHLAHAARADLLRRLERLDDAVAAYRAALACEPNDVDRRFLERRVAELGGA